MFKIFFHYNERNFISRNKTEIKKFISHIFKKENKSVKRVDYIFCSDEYLLLINQKFLEHNYYTDIITFNLSTTPKLIEGEIYISVDRVQQNAVALRIKLEDEMLRILIHGALHLCGYTDKRNFEVLEMRKKEDFYLDIFGKKKST